MKKLISILLVLSLTLCFGACGKDSDNGATETAATTQATSQQIPEVPAELKGMDLFFDAASYTAVVGEIQKVSDDVYSVSTAYSLRNKENIDKPLDIVIDSKELVLGTTTVSGLINSGWKMYSDLTDDSDVLAYNYAFLNVTNSKCTLTIKVYNGSNNIVSAYDCVVESVSFDGQRVDYDYYGLNSSTTLAQLVDTMGEPTGITIVDYFDGEYEYTHSNVYVKYMYDGFSADFLYNVNGTAEVIKDISFSA